jgi:uncharacterized protein (TIGR02246 family)
VSAADPRAVVERINAAWRAGRAEEAAPLFHPDVILVTPNGERLVGRDAMVRSYAEFAAAAIVDEYAESRHEVDLVGATAWVSYHWEMAWRVGGDSYRERGRDVFLLARENDGWLVVRRQLISDGE